MVKPTKKEKRKAYRKWWWNTYPVDVVRYATAWIMYPIAILFKTLPKKRSFLWNWLDDEIYDESKNQDFREIWLNNPKWLKHYRWHAFRNPMWNWKMSKKPNIARVHCKSNDEIIVEVEVHTMHRRYRNKEGNIVIKHLDLEDPCLEMPVVRWYDKYGNTSWTMFRGERVNWEKSTWGKLKYWFYAHGELYFREGYVEEKKALMLYGKFPFIGIKPVYHRVAKGVSDKWYINVNKKQLKPDR